MIYNTTAHILFHSIGNFHQTTSFFFGLLQQSGDSQKPINAMHAMPPLAMILFIAQILAVLVGACSPPQTLKGDHVETWLCDNTTTLHARVPTCRADSLPPMVSPTLTGITLVASNFSYILDSVTPPPFLPVRVLEAEENVIT